MTQSSKFHAILAINPEAKFETTINESGEEIVTWLDGETPISEEDISAKQAELETANSHIPARKNAYSKLGVEEQLDMMYHDKVDGTTTWQDAIAQIKSDNPKA